MIMEMKVINATDEVYPVPHNISFLLLCYVYHQWHKKEREEKKMVFGAFLEQ